MQQYSKETIKEVASENNFFLENESEIDGELFVQVSTTF
jgi:hypothetical protein